jgi:hypothetical protein
VTSAGADDDSEPGGPIDARAGADAPADGQESGQGPSGVPGRQPESPGKQPAIPGPRPGEPGVPWYVEGLRFECTACGRCCKNHGEGYEYVFSTRAERRLIASRLGMTGRAFEAEYTERVAGSLSFTSKDDACVFLDEAGQCSIYDLRPKQCRTFPFWPELLDSEGAWERDVASFCPGVGQGDLRDVNEIRRRLAEWR